MTRLYDDSVSWGERLGAGGLALVGCALATASLGIFHAVVPLAAGLIGVCLVGWNRPVGSSFVPRRVMMALLVFGVVMVALLSPPGEVVSGIWDPVVYVQAAHAVMEQGTLRFHFPEFNRLPAELLAQVTHDLGDQVDAYPGFRSVSEGTYTSMFLHAYPATMAVLGGVFGSWGVVSINLVLYLISGWLMYAFCRRWMSWRWAVVATLALWLNPVQMWQARFPTAELMTQVLLLGGFLSLKQLAESPHRIRAGIFAGVSFGLALLTRFDVILVVAPLMLFMLPLLPPATSRRGMVVFFGTLLVMLSWFVVHLIVFAPAYRPWGALTGQGLAIWGVGWLIVGAGVWLPCRYPGWGGPAALSWLRRTLVILAAVGVGFAWMIRPRLMFEGDTRELFLSWFPSVADTRFWLILSGRDAWNWILFENMMGVVGLGLGVAGILWLGWTRQDRTIRVWWLISVGVFVLFSITLFHERAMPWMSRRMIPVVIPLISVGIAVSLRVLCEKLPRRLTSPVCIGLVLAMGWNLAPTWKNVVAHRDYSGALSLFRAFDRALPADAVVVVDYPGMGAALRFLHGRTSFQWDGYRAGSWEDFKQIVGKAAHEIPNLHMATMSPHEEELMGWTLVDVVSIESAMMRQSPREWLKGAHRLTVVLYIYRVGSGSIDHD